MAKIELIEDSESESHHSDVVDQEQSDSDDHSESEQPDNDDHSGSEQPDNDDHSGSEQPDNDDHSESEQSSEKKRKLNMNRDQQKTLLRERKARRLHGNVIQAARVAWGSESVKNAPAEERVGRVEAVLHEIKTLISQICLKHDISRLVQSCIKYGNEAQRTVIADGIKGHILELCMNQYGYHVVLKLLRYGSRSVQANVIAELKGNLVRLCQHRVAFKIVDLAWRSSCNTKQKNELLMEIYGKEHSVFRDTSKPAPSMPALLQSLDVKKRDALLLEVRGFLDKCISKGTVQLSMFHTVLRHYLEQIDDRESLLEALKEHTLQICATLDGVFATCIMLDHSSSKLRKAILKSWKGQVARMATDSDGYLAIAKALTIVDDAVLLQKSVIVELLPEISNLMQSPAGSKILLQIVAPGKPRFFTSAERTVLTTVESMSKKPADVRRNDNLKVFIPAMISALNGNFILASTMLRDRLLSGLFEHTLTSAMAMSETESDAAKAYIATFTSCLSQGDLTDLNENHIVAHPVGHRVLKSLCGSSQSLMHPVFTNFCISNLTAMLKSRAVWILVTLVESIPTVRSAVKKSLKSMDCSTEPGLKLLKELCN